MVRRHVSSEPRAVRLQLDLQHVVCIPSRRWCRGWRLFFLTSSPISTSTCGGYSSRTKSLPSMMDLIRAAIAVVPSTASLIVAVAESDVPAPVVPVRSLSTPSPSIDASGTSTVIPGPTYFPLPYPLSSSDAQRLKDVWYFYVLCLFDVWYINFSLWIFYEIDGCFISLMFYIWI